MGLLPQRANPGATAQLVRLDDENRQAALCGPLRAVTENGAFFELDQAERVELDRDSIDSEPRTLFLVIGGQTAGDPEGDLEAIALERNAPKLGLPALQLSTRTSAGFDRLPVARIWAQAGNLKLDADYVPPCAVVEAHPSLAEEAARWRELRKEISDEALTFVFRFRELPAAAGGVQTRTFIWSVCASAAPVLHDRSLGAERFFQAVGWLGSEILAIVRQGKEELPPPRAGRHFAAADEPFAVAERLATFNASSAPGFNLADAVRDSAILRRSLRKAVQVTNPEQPEIELAGPPTSARETRPDRWKVQIPLARPLGEMIRSDDRILVALTLKQGRDLEVRVHPADAWAKIGKRNIVSTQHDIPARRLDERFNAYFIYPPDDKGLAAREIVFQLKGEPKIDGPNSIALEVVR